MAVPMQNSAKAKQPPQILPKPPGNGVSSGELKNVDFGRFRLMVSIRSPLAHLFSAWVDGAGSSCRAFYFHGGSFHVVT